MKLLITLFFVNLFVISIFEACNTATETTPSVTDTTTIKVDSIKVVDSLKKK
jgi:hypothetical protein